MAVPERLLTLVERFERNRAAYRSGNYNEAQVRVDFINPMLELLGWDVENRQGRPEAYRDVIYEDRVKVGGGTKAPDYGFYAGGARKFFLEAKKPSVNLKDDVDPAVQLRRYAWSAKLPLSILTDFEEFAVYDCRFEPDKDDTPTTARLDFLTFEEYPDRWDDLYDLFSREAVLEGSLEKYAERTRSKRGTQTVDSAFLREIERWRNALAQDFVSRNDLNRRELNYAVQMTINRLVFLRMAEDRGVEDYGRLLALVNGNGVYGRLRELFRSADDKYNSGLFHFRREKDRDEEPDTLTPTLEVDDEVLRGILRGLYYPESPYEFSVLPLDVLGQVYEQFLGRVIRLEDGHRAVVEEKPEVRKAGGVYYTPTYIVNYIVENTVGRLLEGKRPGPTGGARKLRIVDPACGSGSFLIGAYEYLLDWHRDRYLEDGPQKHANRMYQGAGGQWHLTIDEKKRILLNNIFGVDIDPQAVEVTKLSLLLKVLEGESQQTLERQLFAERALPDLDDNIKCGNSLIGPDLYDDQDMVLFSEDDYYRINVFDWRRAFPQVFEGDDPGFDAVIGNPPYLFITEQKGSDKSYFSKRYATYSYRYDVYGLFIETAFENLLRTDGCFGFIIPHTLPNNDSFERLRRYLLENTKLDSIIDLGPGVFEGARNETMLLFARNGKAAPSHHSSVVKSDRRLNGLDEASFIPQSWFRELPKAAFVINTNSAALALLKRLLSIPTKLGQFCTLNQGLRTGNNERYPSSIKELPSHKPVVGGKDISRYFTRQNLFVQYEPEKLDAPRKDSIFTSAEKLIVQEVRNITLPRRLVAAYDDKQLYCLQTTNVINLKETAPASLELKYLLGLINSNLLNWFFRTSFPSNNHIASNQLAQLPIRTIDFSDPEDRARHDRMVGLVERMLDLHERLAEAKIGQEKTVIQHQIDATDRQIDRLVYELYGLTDDEISIVEEATTR